MLSIRLNSQATSFGVGELSAMNGIAGGKSIDSLTLKIILIIICP